MAVGKASIRSSFTGLSEHRRSQCCAAWAYSGVGIRGCRDARDVAIHAADVPWEKRADHVACGGFLAHCWALYMLSDGAGVLGVGQRAVGTAYAGEVAVWHRQARLPTVKTGCRRLAPLGGRRVASQGVACISCSDGTCGMSHPREPTAAPCLTRQTPTFPAHAAAFSGVLAPAGTTDRATHLRCRACHCQRCRIMPVAPTWAFFCKRSRCWQGLCALPGLGIPLKQDTAMLKAILLHDAASRFARSGPVDKIFWLISP